MQTENVKYANRYDKAINNVKEAEGKLKNLKKLKSDGVEKYTEKTRQRYRELRKSVWDILFEGGGVTGFLGLGFVVDLVWFIFHAIKVIKDGEALWHSETYVELFPCILFGIWFVIAGIITICINARKNRECKKELAAEKAKYYRLDAEIEKAESELAGKRRWKEECEGLIRKAEEAYEEAIQMKQIAAENAEDEAAARKFRSKMDYAFKEGSVKARKFVGKEKYDEAMSGVHEFSEKWSLLEEAASLGCEEAIVMYAGLLFRDATSGKYTNAEKAEKFKEVDKLLTQEVTAANKDALFLKKFLKYCNGDISSDELTDYLHYLRDIEKEHSLSESLNPLVPDLISRVVSEINRRNTVIISSSSFSFSDNSGLSDSFKRDFLREHSYIYSDKTINDVKNSGLTASQQEDLLRYIRSHAD